MRQQRRFLAGIGERDVDDIDRQQRGLARIKTALVHLQVRNGRAGNAQTLGRQRGELVQRLEFGVVLGVVGNRREGKFQFCNPDHGLYLSSKGVMVA